MSSSSGSYRIELLNEDNYIPWKRRVIAILRDRDLLGHVDGTTTKPEPATAGSPTAAEKKAIEDWEKNDGKAQSVIELSLGNEQMTHISQANTAKEMWEQIRTVKEARGDLGAIAYRRRLYRTVADETTDIPTHIKTLREIQSMLISMGEKIEDKEFITILISSLPETWDQFTSSYLGARNAARIGSTNTTGTTTTTSPSPSTGTAQSSISTFELIALIMDEDRRRKEKSGTAGGDSALAAMSGRGKDSRGNRSQRGGGEGDCFNCGKRGHYSKDCWSKGGGAEGKAPNRKKKGRQGGSQAHQGSASAFSAVVPSDAVLTAETASTKTFDAKMPRDAWLSDSGCTTHIA